MERQSLFTGFEMIQDIVKLRWVPEILESMDKGNHRYTDILNSIPYLSHTELQRKLAFLQEKGVLEKTQSDQGVHYHLKPFGCDLIHVFFHFVDLGKKYYQ